MESRWPDAEAVSIQISKRNSVFFFFFLENWVEVMDTYNIHRVQM